MKAFFFWPAVFSFLFALAAQPAQAQALERDVLCAAAAALKITQLEPDSQEELAVWAVATFFFGRLSAQDAAVNWGARVMEHVSEVATWKDPDKLFAVCTTFYFSKTIVPTK